jgi:hypothetical protein
MFAEKDFFSYALKNYERPNSSTIEEFRSDLLRFKYLNRLLTRYESGGEVDILLILNHFIILYNIFESSACTKMIFYKLKDHKTSVKTFLLFLNYMPDRIPELSIISSDIPIDYTIADKLRAI